MRTLKIWHKHKHSWHLPQPCEHFLNPAQQKDEDPSQTYAPNTPISVTSWSLEHFSTWLTFSFHFSLCSHPVIPVFLAPGALTHTQVSAAFPNFFLSFYFFYRSWCFFLHYLLDWFSLSALLIRPLFRSIFPNQYLISERSAGLLLYVLWRIVKTHRPSSPFNLFTPKVMKYWIGLMH